MDNGPLEHFGLVMAALDGDPVDPDSALTALAHLAGLRAILDQAEHDLTEAARAGGIGWSRIAITLGLRSRQAAEQRWLRLAAPIGRDPAGSRTRRRSQQDVDGTVSPAIARLRAAAVRTLRQLTALPDWNHPRADLIKSTLDMAAEAPPGALYTLAEKAINDLDTTTVRADPAPLHRALTRLREALDAARPD